ncbi:MAG: GFA family protein [Pseudomonadota bacterium]
MSDGVGSETRAAACSCGAVSVEVRGAPAFQAVCSCRDCQSRTGSAFGTSAYFEAAQVLARRGEPTVYRRMSSKGRWLDFRFCPTCGVSVWWEAEFLPGKVGVAATLFGDDAFRPDGAYFCASKPDWVSFDAAIPFGLGPTTGS